MILGGGRKAFPAESQGRASAGRSMACPQGTWGQMSGPSPAPNFYSLPALGPGTVTFRIVNSTL